MRAVLVRKSVRFLIKLVIVTTRQIFGGHNFTQTSTLIIAEDTEKVAVSWYMKTAGCKKIYFLHPTLTLMYLQTCLMDLWVSLGLSSLPR